jgi:MFS family permease
MNRAGRLTDRVGGGPVVIAGLFALLLGTVAFTQVRADTPYWVLELSLFVRGFGLGFTMMPAMAAAYSGLERWQVPRATPMLNVIQRVGGSLGTALLAVVLQHQLAHAPSRAPGAVATGFGHTYWWAMAMTALALAPALVLARAQRSRAGGAPAPVPTVG